METIKLNWRKRFFSNTWNIYRENRYAGFINKPLFSRKATAEIDGKRYKFRDKIKIKSENWWFEVSETEIMDNYGSAIGKIKYSDDGQDFEYLRGFINAVKKELEGIHAPQAFIETSDETSIWAFRKGENWSDKWVVKNSAGLNIEYNSSFSKRRGQIEANKDNGLKIISGLYISATRSRAIWLLWIVLPIVVAFPIVVGDPLQRILDWIF